MRDRALLVLYVVLVVVATVVHRPLVLGLAAAVVLASAGTRAPRLLRRTARAALPFALAVSLGYMLVARDDLGAAGRTLLLVNVRVLLLVMLGFRILPALDLQRAVGFSRTLRFVLVLTTSQVLTFRRLFTDFRLALAARTTRRVGLLTALRQGAATGAWFLRRAEHDAGEIAQALETRGFFLDRD
jgi:cobalt/nickel transport system permease protein